MNTRLSPKALVRALSIALAAAMAPALAAQIVQSRTISFEDMTPTVDGEIVYGIYAAAHKEGTLPTDEFVPDPGDGTVIVLDPSRTDPPPRLPKTYFFAPLQFVDVFSVSDHHWWSPRGFFAPRPITEEEALLNGASQEDIDRAKDRIKGWPRTAFMGLYETSYMPDKANGIRYYGYDLAASDRAKGGLLLNATLPAHPGDRWALRVVSALGETRALLLDLAAGRHEITITDVEAGNVPVALFAVDANGNGGTYFQEIVALVRKHGATGAPGGDGIATVDMEFAGQNASDRYRIGYLGAGNRSQSDRAGLPVQSKSEAMLRAMAYDAYGASVSDRNLFTLWSVHNGGLGYKSFTSHVSGRHARSGLIFKPEEVDQSRNEHIGLGPKIPKSHLQFQPDPDLPDPNRSPLYLIAGPKLVETQVVTPRTITIIGHDVTNANGGNWSYGEGNPNHAVSMTSMIESVKDIFPYSEIDYRYGGSIPVVGATTSPSLADAWSAMFARFGAQTIDPHAGEVTLHLGFTNITDSNWAGMARYTSMVVTVKPNVLPEELSVIVAHEMGHCFGLSHAPGWGAADVDGNYPYGGGGLTGGWGYTRYSDLFFAEDDHAPDKLFPKAYWDVMSFGPERVKFSDYNAAKLLPAAGLVSAAPQQPASQVPAGNEPFKCK